MSDKATVTAVLAEEWGRVLGIPADQAADGSDFFALGGNSIMAVELIEAVERRLHTTLPLEVLFLEGTFEALVDATLPRQ